MKSKKVPEFDIMEICFELDALCYDTTNGIYSDGLEAHEKLFGKDNLHKRLQDAGEKLPDYMQRFDGPVHQIADFAVTSGHEAVAFFASRLASYTGLRKKWVTDERAASEIGLGSTLLHEHNHSPLRLEKAGENFLAAVQGALRGWFENRAWINRSIFKEQLGAGLKPSAEGAIVDAQAHARRRIKRGGMPEKILSALEQAGGSMKRKDLIAALAPDSVEEHKKLRDQIANYLAPRGGLIAEGLILVDEEVVTITPAGSFAISK